MQEYSIAIDLGGTNIRAGIVTQKGLEPSVLKMATRASEGPDKILKRIGDSVQSLREGHDPAFFKGVGIGAPGPLNATEGIVLCMPNLPGWDNFELRQRLSHLLDCRVEIVNDADAAAWGEFRFGKARGVSDFALLTLGTGLGSSLFLGGVPWKGVSGISAELGHIPVAIRGPVCSCGAQGHFESYLSSKAIAESVLREIRLGNKTAVRVERLISDDSGYGIEEVITKAFQGDKVARKALDRYGLYLGKALATITNLLNLPLIVLGGGISNAWPLISETALNMLRKSAFRWQADAVRVEISELPDASALLGAGSMMLSFQGK